MRLETGHLNIKSWWSFRLILQHRKVQNILDREFGLNLGSKFQ